MVNSEYAQLLHSEPQEHRQPEPSARGTGIDFRTVERNSSLRADIFLMESILVLGFYLGAIWWKFMGSAGKGEEEEENIRGPSGFVQASILASFGIVYIFRLNVMSRWLLKRELSMEELSFVILIWVPSILGSYAHLADRDVSPAVLVVSVILYFWGSYLNSYSEYQRMVWKQDPSHKGRCYTIGLFSYSRNINYFGDSVLFTGWALSTGNWLNAWAPIAMSSMFYFIHIPGKEAYLAERYHAEWKTYEKTVKSFVPFIC